MYDWHQDVYLLNSLNLKWYKDVNAKVIEMNGIKCIEIASGKYTFTGENLHRWLYSSIYVTSLLIPHGRRMSVTCPTSISIDDINARDNGRSGSRRLL